MGQRHVNYSQAIRWNHRKMTVTITFEAIPEGTEVDVQIEIPTGWPDEAIGSWEAALENLENLREST